MGLEPTTNRLTADYSAIELPRIGLPWTIASGRLIVRQADPDPLAPQRRPQPRRGSSRTAERTAPRRAPSSSYTAPLFGRLLLEHPLVGLVELELDLRLAVGPGAVISLAAPVPLARWISRSTPASSSCRRWTSSIAPSGCSEPAATISSASSSFSCGSSSSATAPGGSLIGSARLPAPQPRRRPPHQRAREMLLEIHRREHHGALLGGGEAEGQEGPFGLLAGMQLGRRTAHRPATRHTGALRSRRRGGARRRAPLPRPPARAGRASRGAGGFPTAPSRPAGRAAPGGWRRAS